MDKAIEIQPDTANIRINVGADGVWLHFKSNAGKYVSLNVSTSFINRNSLGGVSAEALDEWRKDRLDQAASIRSLERGR